MILHNEYFGIDSNPLEWINPYHKGKDLDCVQCTCIMYILMPGVLSNEHVSPFNRTQKNNKITQSECLLLHSRDFNSTFHLWSIVLVSYMSLNWTRIKIDLEYEIISFVNFNFFYFSKNDVVFVNKHELAYFNDFDNYFKD